jgi:hypothetical protein
VRGEGVCGEAGGYGVSIKRHNPTRDANEPEIMALYHARGCSVHRIPDGPFDLIIGYFDKRLGPQSITVEVKRPAGPKGGTSHAKLTPRELEYLCGHKGRHYIVCDEAGVEHSLDPSASAIVSRGCR